MPRKFLSCLLVASSFALLTKQGHADEPRETSAAKSDTDDELYRLLKGLKRELEGLRGDLRNSRDSMRGVSKKPALKPSSRPPVKVPTTSNRTPSARPRTGGSVQPLATVPISRATSDHWAFQRMRSPGIPDVRDNVWGRDELDRFIQAQREATGLRPNPDANRYTLIRRVAFDLTGLPPTAVEIRQFLDDDRSLDEALARVVDRYLASTRFGERWGRHWLDVVRYADSVGRNWNAPFTYAWRYRDYVIDSFNSDKPYDRFVTEQLAGDLLPANTQAVRREQSTATGFLAMGSMDIIVPEGEQLMMDRIDEQIDVTSRALLGLTVSCARCHDHKYEPIAMRDYYALAGIFYSTETRSGQRRGNYVADDDLLLLPSSGNAKSPSPGVHSMADITREHRSGGWREVLYTTDPNLAMGALEGRVRDCPLRIDGEFYKQGNTPPRGEFRIGGLTGLQRIPANSSGRLQLAQWIVSPDNPLAARVMANRIWQHLFGRGLVASVDNFGNSGESPTHPELLDHLAARFQKNWSVKSLIRAIVLSRTYRQSSRGQTAAQKRDPGNNLYWRMNVKRLEVEAVRDAMLQAAGRLEFRRPTGIQVAGTGGKGKWGATRSLLTINAPYRTIYLPVLRSLLPEMYTTFDFPNPTQLKGQREVTTVAPQALFLMNSDFAVGCARDAAQQLLLDRRSSEAERVETVYMRILGRRPDGEEITAARTFLASLSPPSTRRSGEEYRWAALIQALMIGGEFRSLL